MSEPMNPMPDRSRRQTRLFALGALLVAGAAFVVIAVGGIGKNLVYYWNPTQLVDAGNKAYGATIRLGGMVKQGSIVRTGSTSLEFDVTDYTKSVHVKAAQMPPAMFREGIGVVIEGTMTRGGYFDGQRLMVSHNNEYKAPKPGEKVDVEKMIRSTEGFDGSKK